MTDVALLDRWLLEFKLANVDLVDTEDTALEESFPELELE
jgi:hypothetical protein